MIEEKSYQTHEGTKYKRFIIFGSYHYYPNGGMKDARATADTLAELLYWQVEQGVQFDYDFWHILDCQTMEIVKEG